MGKHLNLSQRIIIESKLNENISLRKIGEMVGKPHTTISREILSRRVLSKGNHFNNFNTFCKTIENAPFVCNGCSKKYNCKKNKYFYYAKDANDDYRKILVESRQGIDFENKDFRNMDKIIKDEVDKGHSFYMIILDHPEFDITERTLYYYQKKGYLSTKNIDLPRIVRYKKRNRVFPKNKSERKEQLCRINRTYQDFLKYKEDNNITSYVEMDTVEGTKGHSALLTLNYIPFNFIIAYKIDEQTISEVTDKINKIKNIIGLETFHKIFSTILTDNGKEFKRPDLIEDNGPDIIKSKVFYCDSRKSDQKASIEVTHEYIRRFIEQGTDIDKYSDNDILLMLNHINSTPRKSLKDKTPYEVFNFMMSTSINPQRGKEILDLLNINEIKRDEVILKPYLIKHNKKN